MPAAGGSGTAAMSEAAVGTCAAGPAAEPVVAGASAGAGGAPASGGWGGEENSTKGPRRKGSTTRITEREAERGKALAEAALLLTGALIPAPLADKRGRFCGSNASTGAASTFSVRQTLAASARTNTLSVSTE